MSTNIDRDLASARALADEAAALAETPEVWPNQLDELTEIVRDELKRRGIESEDQARPITYGLVARLCREYGGGRVYWPKTDVLERALRNLKIWSEYDGTADGPNGVLALSRRHKLSSNAVYTVLKRQREQLKRQEDAIE